MPFLVDVEATVVVTNMYDAPSIRFSYPGSVELTQLWVELQMLGWTIPELPAIPYQASSWIGDARYSREHEFRVQDFEIFSGNWPLHEIADRAMETVNLLRRMGVDVHMPISYLDFLRKAQLQQRANRASMATQAPAVPVTPAPVAVIEEPVIVLDDGPLPIPDAALANPPLVFPESEVEEVPAANDGPLMTRTRPAPAAAPAGRSIVEIPEVILLSAKPWAVQQHEPGMDVYKSVVVPGRTRWIWSETANHLSEVGATLADPKILFETVELGWQRTADEVPMLSIDPNSERVLWFIAHEFHEATTLVSFLHEQRETSARVIPMTPIPNTTAFDDCFLVAVVVPIQDYANIGSKVVANYADVIARGKVHTDEPVGMQFTRL